MFYKREIGVDDVRAINPKAMRYDYEIRETVDKLVELAYMRRNEDRFQITEFGATKLAAYESWKKKNFRER